MGSGFGISYFPIILEKSSNLLIIDVYTVKNVKKSKKCFLSYDLPDSADRSVSRRRYYRNSREIMGLQEKLKYSNLVLRTSKIVDFRNLPEILYRISRILPYITVRDRGGTAIYTSILFVLFYICSVYFILCLYIYIYIERERNRA